MRHGMTYAQIAEVLGVSSETVRNIERKALWKLKRSGKLDKFKDLLEAPVEEYYGENYRRIKHGK